MAPRGKANGDGNPSDADRATTFVPGDSQGAHGADLGGDPATPPASAGNDEARMMVASQVLIISAPSGPRRRAGLSFDKAPRELTWEELGDNPEATLEALRADPMLKIDGRWEETPFEQE